jgi:D-tagatose-bisphosphate aldolase class II non-catalytic subunit
MAERAAELCAVAEVAASQPLSYVIGTEVPIPGGETEALDGLAVTRPEAVLCTHALHESAFNKLGLADAFARVTALVVQPGVDFGNSQIISFNPSNATRLILTASAFTSAAFEAHSTDYQSLESLAGLVSGHFAILKVGPELTFAYREALFAMAAIEQQLSFATRSNLVKVIGEVMNADDRHWRGYIASGEQQQAQKLFGFSDRVRYYWPNARIAGAVEHLQSNIDQLEVPAGLILQYAGAEAFDRSGASFSRRIIDGKIGAVVRKYLVACGAA